MTESMSNKITGGWT